MTGDRPKAKVIIDGREREIEIVQEPDQHVVLGAGRDRSRPLASRQLWRRPAAEFLALLRAGRIEVATDEDRVLIGDLRAALEDIATD